MGINPFDRFESFVKDGRWTGTAKQYMKAKMDCDLYVFRYFGPPSVVLILIVFAVVFALCWK